jgi:hypothetical protein
MYLMFYKLPRDPSNFILFGGGRGHHQPLPGSATDIPSKILLVLCLCAPPHHAISWYRPLDLHHVFLP